MTSSYSMLQSSVFLIGDVIHRGSLGFATITGEGRGFFYGGAGGVSKMRLHIAAPLWLSFSGFPFECT